MQQQHIYARQLPTGFPPSDAQQAPVINDSTAGQYVQAAQLADALPGVKGGNQGNLAVVPGQVPSADGNQYPWNQDLGNVTANAAVNGSETAGWQSLPDVPGFVLNDTLQVFNTHKNESGIMPFYMAVDDPSTVKRFIVVLPGKVSSGLPCCRNCV